MIASVVAEAKSVLPEAHVLVVDDGSWDHTADAARATSAELSVCP